MRPFDGIRADVLQAMSVNDAEALLRLSEELDTDVSTETRALACMSRGIAYRLHGEYHAPLDQLHGAMAHYEELDSRGSMASAAGNIGSVYVDIGDHAVALEYYHQALATYEEIGDRYRIALLTGNIGNLYRKTGENPLALEQYHRSLAMHEELGNRSGIAAVTGNIGNVYRTTGNYPLALEHYHRALSLHEELGNRNGVAIVTSSIGNIHVSTGDLKQALALYERSLALHQELGDRASIAHVTGSIGSVYSALKDYPSALEHYHRALTIHEQHGDRASVARVTASVVDALIMLGQFAEAETRLQEMQQMQIDDPTVAISRVLSVAAVQDHNGLVDEAVATLHNALAIAQQYSVPEMEADVHQRLRDHCQRRNDLPGYIEHNNASTRITEEINGKDTALKLAMQEKQREIDAREREHAKHMAVLHSTLPKHIADRVARGEVVNDSFDNAAVLFLDVVGFTTHASALDAAVVVDLLQTIFTTFDAICAEHNVMKIKTIGDSYMAVAFPSEHHVEDLAAVALAMQACEFVWPHTNERVMFRIGLHCGPVVAGVLGTERMQYDVWGDAVNVASRMESSGEAGRVHTSEAFASNLKMSQESRIKSPISESHEVSLDTRHSSLVTTFRGMVDIKGKGPMQTYWLETDA
jgi:adenylate cyclase